MPPPNRWDGATRRVQRLMSDREEAGATVMDIAADYGISVKECREHIELGWLASLRALDGWVSADESRRGARRKLVEE